MQEQSPPTSPVALITGAGRDRLGQHIARDLASRGYHIALHYHSSAEAAQQAQRDLQQAGSCCEIFQADVTQETSVQQMFAELTKTFQRLDVLVTTASVWSQKKLEDVTAQDVKENFEVNSLGTFLCAQAAGLQMVKQPQGGSIILIGDASLGRPYLHHAPYFISKGALPTMTRMLAVELGERNPQVRVNCLEPGPVLFPPDASVAEQQALIRSTLVKQADCPEMVALTVRFLIENSFMTGCCLPIDGGKHCYQPDEVERLRG